jgi:sporulation protein YlmC with PRC-barrel domain
MLEQTQDQIPPIGVEPVTISSLSLIDKPIMSLQGETIGKLEDVAFDVHTGRISFTLLSFEGSIEPGNILVAIPWYVLKLSLEEKALYLDREIDFIQKAPGYDLSHFPSPTDTEWLEELYRYYGHEAYWL